MTTCSHYAMPTDIPLDIQTGSRCTDKAPLVVNCAGCFDTKYPFQTDNQSGREDYYLMLLMDGSLRVTLPDGEQSAGRGTLLVFPPHYPYRYSYDGAEPLRYLWVHFSGSHAAFYLDAFGLSRLPLMDNCTGIGEAAAIFEAMFRAFREGDTMRDAALGCHLERLLLALAEDRRTPSTKPCAILRSLEYIDSHYTEVFPVTALSRMEGLSYSRYHDVFVAEMGVSPRRYITRLRLRHACELLCSTDMSIAQIGMQVGYDDPSFFSKLFKKEIGISPLRYREQNSESAHDRPRGRSSDGSLSPIE